MMFSHREDATLLNPIGSLDHGFEQVAETIERFASQVSDGEVTSFDVVEKYVTPELGYVVFLQTGGSHGDAGNGTLEPVAVSIDPQYGTLGPFRTPGATGTRWSVLLAWKRGTAPCVAGPEGKRRA